MKKLTIIGLLVCVGLLSAKPCDVKLKPTECEVAWMETGYLYAQMVVTEYMGTVACAYNKQSYECKVLQDLVMLLHYDRKTMFEFESVWEDD